MVKGSVRELLKQGLVKAVRVSESEFERGLMFALAMVSEFLSDASVGDIEEFFAGVFKGWVTNVGFKLLVVRLDGNRGFVFIKSPEEFVKFVRKYYGGIEKLVKYVVKHEVEKGRVAARYIAVLNEVWFKRVFLRMIESDIRYMGKDGGRIRFENIVRSINLWWEYGLRRLKEYGVGDGVLFNYNGRWVEILTDGSGDYRSLLEFLEDEYGSLVNWIREEVLKGYIVKVEGEV